MNVIPFLSYPSTPKALNINMFEHDSGIVNRLTHIEKSKERKTTFKNLHYSMSLSNIEKNSL